MKINEYYKQSANLSLNSSIVALIPVVFFIWGNFVFIQLSDLMLLNLPFFIYSFSCFQLFLFRKNQAITSTRGLRKRKEIKYTFSECEHFLIVSLETSLNHVFLYHPDGILIGELREIRAGILKRISMLLAGKIYHQQYIFYDQIGNKISSYSLNRKKRKIDAYNNNNKYLGTYLESNNKRWINEGKLFLANGKLLGEIKSSILFKDDQILNKDIEMGRLRKGWLPLDWYKRFPDANIPVFHIKSNISEQERLVSLSLIIKDCL